MNRKLNISLFFEISNSRTKKHFTSGFFPQITLCRQIGDYNYRTAQGPFFIFPAPSFYRFYAKTKPFFGREKSSESGSA